MLAPGISLRCCIHSRRCNVSIAVLNPAIKVVILDDSTKPSRPPCWPRLFAEILSKLFLHLGWVFDVEDWFRCVDEIGEHGAVLELYTLFVDRELHGRYHARNDGPRVFQPNSQTKTLGFSSKETHKADGVEFCEPQSVLVVLLSCLAYSQIADIRI